MNYPDTVDIKNITIDEEQVGADKFRYSLSIPINETGKSTLLVVMMNPSKATKEESDLTINRVIGYVNKNNLDYSVVSIVNLYPIYQTYSQDLKNYESLTKKNLDKIELLLEKSDHVLFGWGKPKGKSQKELHDLKYHHNALSITKLCLQMNKSTFIIDSLRDDLYPKHLGRVSYELKMSLQNLNVLKTILENRIVKNTI